MATGSNGKTYGVGDAADKMNIGPNVGADSKLDAEGKVYDDGELVFDPKVDGVRVRQDDPDIYGDGESA